MAVRGDIYVDYAVSPRIVWVAAPSVEVTMSDLLDTLRNIEQQPQNMDDEVLVSAAGAEDLGGGVFVGLTVTLQNAQLAFEERTTSVSEGTATSADVSGKFLTDTAADFVSDGVTRGATVLNVSDESACTVIQVLSPTQLRCTPLKDGTENDWDIGESYKIWNTIQCDVTGGNLVAVDTGGSPISSIFPTAFTQVVRTSSASATIAQLEIENIQRLIETQRASHVGTGNIYYWDPFAGDNNNTGDRPESPVATFAKAHDLCADYNHDIIICQPGNTTGPTISTETITISKSHVMLRGPGLDFRLIPTSTTAPTIKITGTGVEVSSMYVSTAATGGQTAIAIDGGGQALVRDILIQNPNGTGVSVTNSELSLIDNVEVQSAGSHGFYAGNNAIDLDLKNCHADNCGGDGFSLTGTNVYHTKVRGKGTAAHYNTAYGLNIAATASDTLLDMEGTIQNNIAGDINDNGTNTTYSGMDHSYSFQGYVWIDTNSGITGTNYPRGTPTHPVNNLADAFNIADELGLTSLRVRGSVSLDRSYAGWRIDGYASVETDVITLNSQNVDGTIFNRVTLTGTGTGSFSAESCLLDNVTGVAGIAARCGFKNTTTLAAAATFLINDSYSISAPAVFDVAGANSTLRGGVNGDIRINNVGAGSEVSVGQGYGTVVIDATCTDGDVTIQGNSAITDNSGAGCSVAIEAVPVATRIDMDANSDIAARTALIPALV